MEVRKSVASEPLVTKIDQKRIKSQCSYTIFRLFRSIHTSLYFYFAPFYITLAPVIYLMIIKKTNQ
jgi:hypothetical protein